PRSQDGGSGLAGHSSCARMICGCGRQHRVVYQRAERPRTAYALVFEIVVEDDMNLFGLVPKTQNRRHELSELYVFVVVVKPLRGSRESLLVPGAGVASMQPKDRESWVRHFPDRWNAARKALRLIDNDVGKAVIALER